MTRGEQKTKDFEAIITTLKDKVLDLEKINTHHVLASITSEALFQVQLMQLTEQLQVAVEKNKIRNSKKRKRGKKINNALKICSN